MIELLVLHDAELIAAAVHFRTSSRALLTAGTVDLAVASEAVAPGGEDAP